jgi:hypothetical protein
MRNLYTTDLKNIPRKSLTFKKGYFNNYLCIGKPIEMLAGTISDQYSFGIPF